MAATACARTKGSSSWKKEGSVSNFSLKVCVLWSVSEGWGRLGTYQSYAHGIHAGPESLTVAAEAAGKDPASGVAFSSCPSYLWRLWGDCS